MTSIYTNSHLRGEVSMKVTDAKTGLLIEAGGNADCHIAGLPAHVATHTAAAFNRAMQAEPTQGGYWYKAGEWSWLIHFHEPGGYGWQREDVEPDSPPYLHGSARDVIAAMDEIDTVIREYACEDCAGLFDDLTEVEGVPVCRSCLWERGQRAHEMREMADCDKAHAEMDRRAGL